jgi:hypothetical protein
MVADSEWGRRLIDERNAARLAKAYLAAKRTVLESQYATELVSHRRSLATISETEFLREIAWVILSAGMAERIVRLKFDAVSESFCLWNSADEIAMSAETCMSKALAHFGHLGKIAAIAFAAKKISEQSFVVFRTNLQQNPVFELRQFRYIGPVTVLHLAKNIGIETAKPDRHLNRISNLAGFPSAQKLCAFISSFVGDSVTKVDTVLWRFATINPDYLEDFASHLHTGTCDQTPPVWIKH